MAIITPRRKFLITAPLALLLPAGLLTYLGFETVKGVDIQYEIIARDKVSDITASVRDRTNRSVMYDIQKPFRDNFVQTGIDQFPNFPLPNHCSFRMTDPVPAAQLIFVYGPDQRLYFFHRKIAPEEDEDNTIRDNPCIWELSSNEPVVFTSQLKSIIDTEAEALQSNYSQSLRPINNLSFRTLRFPPEDLHPSDGIRNLIFYTFLNDQEQSSGIIAIGMSIDFNYINTHLFQDLLDNMVPEYQTPPDISIEDASGNIRVASTFDLSKEETNSGSRYFPSIFNDEYFPWYRIHFSPTIWENTMQTAKEMKLFYYSLIATANLIMIASVIGALRNISKELALSDLRSNFVARVSHELRTPLGLIRLYSETLELNRAKNEEKRKEYLHAITKESERLTHMINNILNFSRIEANSQHYSFSMCSVEPVVLDTADTMRYHFERHGLDLNVSVDENLPDVHCDPEALQQALYNLINNAMKYTGNGKEIDVRAYSGNGQIIISVTDRGIGIAPDQQDKIFDEFYRVDDPQVRETGGSGLGLAVVKHIVEAHQGQLKVKSQPNQGSTFSIHIPNPNERKEHGNKR